MSWLTRPTNIGLKTFKPRRWVILLVLAVLVTSGILIAVHRERLRRRASAQRAVLAGGSERVIKAVQTVQSKLNQEQRDTIAAITSAFLKAGDGDIRKLAYILATCQRESGFRNIREYKSEPGSYNWETYQKNYWDTGYYGRGLPQLTGISNYRKYSQILGIDLVNNPDLMLNPDIGARVLVDGMLFARFTKYKLSDYINEYKTDFYNARRTINGMVPAHARQIADNATKIYNALANPA